MFLEFKKFNIIDTNGVISLKNDDMVIEGNQLGWVYNDGPPHDHNRSWRGAYLEDLHPDSFKGKTDVWVAVQEICPYHIGKDCSCRGGFIISPLLYKGKVIMDLYNLVEKSDHGYYFH